MMEEIKKNGPIVVSLKVSLPLLYYKDGIYKHIEDNEWIIKGEKRPEWIEVSHSVLCYGWGESKGVKYWLLQNSWGHHWGDRGNFKMLRGDDSGGIESNGEASMPYVVKFEDDIIEKDKFNQIYL